MRRVRFIGFLWHLGSNLIGAILERHKTALEIMRSFESHDCDYTLCVLAFGAVSVIFDILESPAFKKYSTCYVFYEN